MTKIDFEVLQGCAHRIGTHFHDHEREQIQLLADWMVDLIDDFTQQAAPLMPAPVSVPARRQVGTRPSPEEDPYNAIVRWANVEALPGETTSDVLAGKRIGMKDIIQVAGVPISVADVIVEGYVPQEDAVVTERLLRAGGRIVAMTNLEGMAFGGGGESGIYGATRNPHDLSRSTAGSSGGSAAALFYDGIDITFGTDQGGSVRLPASWCGVLGLKPTHGLVPYTGIASHDQTLDHVGPMTRTTENMAAAMQAVAGAYWGDPRQVRAEGREFDFLAAVRDARSSYEGVRFGVLQESLVSDGTPDREAALKGFQEALDKIEKLGGELVQVSIPEQSVAGPILFGVVVEGVMAALHGMGDGYHWNGRHSIELRRAVGKGMLAYGGDLQPAYKTAAALGEFLRSHRFGEVYATAQAVIPRLRQAYDDVLEDVDVVVMPTTPTAAMELRPDADIFERQTRSFSMTQDTPAANVTGHPGLSMPAAQAGDLPLGVMLIGPHFSDARLIELARTWESAYGWLPADDPTR